MREEESKDKVIYFYSVDLLDKSGHKTGSDSNFIELYEKISDVSDFDRLLETLQSSYSKYHSIQIISFNRV